MALLFVIGMHAGYAGWTNRTCFYGCCVLIAVAIVGAAVYETNVLAGAAGRILKMLLLVGPGFCFGRWLTVARGS